MTRNIRFGDPTAGDTIDFATRAEFSVKSEYFSDFVFSGTRDKRIYGLTKISPTMSFGYDVNGLKFLGRYVLGSLQATIGTATNTFTPSDLTYTTVSVDIDGDKFNITSALCDSWELTAEAGNPVKAEAAFTAINYGTAQAVGPYTADFSSSPFMLSDCTLKITGTGVDFQRFNLKITNNVEPIFKASTLASTIRLTGLEVEGRIRGDKYGNVAGVTDGSLDFIMTKTGLGTLAIIVPVIKITEIPPKATGFEVPETEYSFQGYPGSATDAVKATINAPAAAGKF